MSTSRPPYSSNQFGEGSDWQTPEPRSQSGCVIVVLIFGGGLLALSLCSGLAVYFAQRRGTETLLPRETLAEKIAASTAAFSADDVGTDAETLRQLTRLMNAIERAARQEDEEAFLELIDFDRMMDYVLQSEAGRRINFVERMTLPLQLREGILNEGGFQRIIIRHVDGDERGAIVYVHGIDEPGSTMEYRYWVFRDKDQWKIADWERLDLGSRHSVDWALYWRYAVDPRLEEYFDALRDVEEATGLTTEGTEDELEQTLQRAEARSVPPEFFDVQMVTIAYAWQGAGRYADALRCLDRVQNPDATPGAWYCRANCRAGLEDYEGAVEAANRYEATLGPAPDVCGYKAGWLEALDREGEALAEWRKALRADPTDVDALGSLLRLLPDESKGEVVDYLNKSPQPLEAARELITYVRLDLAGLAALEQFVAKQAPDSALQYYLRGVASNAREDYEAAAQVFRQAAEVATNPDDKQYYENEYLTAMNDCNQVVAGYESAFDRNAAFQYLIGEEHEDYLELAEDEREAILTKHAAYAPADPWVDYYRGSQLLVARDYEAAANAFAVAASKPTKEDENEFVVRRAQVSAMAKAGRAVEALTTVDASPESFQALLQACREAQRWDDLKPLADAFRARHPEDPLNDYCAALMLMRDGKWDEAEAKLIAMQDAADDVDYLIDSELTAVRARPDRWQAAYANAENQAEAFGELARTLFEHAWHADVAALVERHHDKFPQDLEPAYWDVRNSVVLGTESQFVDRWLPLRDAFLSTDESWRTTPVVRLLWKTWWDMGRHDEARSLAQELQQRKSQFHSEWIAFLVYSHRTSEGLEAAREAMDDGQSYLLYNDEDVGPILRSSEYAALHDEFPLPVTGESRGQLVLLLLREPLANTQQTLATAFSQAGAPATVVAVPELNGHPSSFVVDHNGLKLRVTAGTRPLQVAESYPPQPLPSVVLDVQRQHQAWLEIRTLVSEDGGAAAAILAPLGAALARLADANCLALYLYDENILIPWNDSTPTALAAGTRLHDWKQLGIFANFYLDDSSVDPRPERSFRRELKSQLDALLDGKPRGEFRIQIERSDYSAAEGLWFDVEKYDAKEEEFVGRLMADSLIQPRLRQGRRYTVSRYQVRAAHIKDDRGEFNLAIEN